MTLRFQNSFCAQTRAEMCGVRECPFPRGLIPIPREWPIPGNMAISALKIYFPFPQYSRGIWLIPGEFPIPGKFPFFFENLKKNWTKKFNRFCNESVFYCFLSYLNITNLILWNLVTKSNKFFVHFFFGFQNTTKHDLNWRLSGQEKK